MTQREKKTQNPKPRLPETGEISSEKKKSGRLTQTPKLGDNMESFWLLPSTLSLCLFSEGGVCLGTGGVSPQSNMTQRLIGSQDILYNKICTAEVTEGGMKLGKKSTCHLWLRYSYAIQYLLLINPRNPRPISRYSRFSNLTPQLGDENGIVVTI